MRIPDRRTCCAASTSISPSPAARRCDELETELGRAGRPRRSIARPTPTSTAPTRTRRRAGTSAISAPTARTGSPTLDAPALRARRAAWPRGPLRRRRAALSRRTWPGPDNVERIEHLAPGQHRGFYAAQRFTLNVTRADMVRRGYSPSVRLFEAACCGVPIISDWWPGLDSFFRPGEEILIAPAPRRGARTLCGPCRRAPRAAIAAAARARVLAGHTGDHRAAELESLRRRGAAARRAQTGVGMKIVIFGLSVSSSWGNGHAALWRGLIQRAARGRPPRRLLRARRALLRRQPRPARAAARAAR